MYIFLPYDADEVHTLMMKVMVRACLVPRVIFGPFRAVLIGMALI
jgi:hypothetical protein